VPVGTGSHNGNSNSQPAFVAEIVKHVCELWLTITTQNGRILSSFKDGCRYGKFGKTKAYELIAQEQIRANKMGGKTLIDLDSIDEYHASLPRVESRAIP
jgi:hypothetical protein